MSSPEDEDEDNVDNVDDEDDFDVSRTKTRKRESLGTGPPAVKDKGKGKAPQPTPEKTEPRSSSSRPTASGPKGRERKRELKLGEVARRRARDDKFGFGGDRFDNAVSASASSPFDYADSLSQTPVQSAFAKPYVDSDSTSSYGDDESEREGTGSLNVVDEDETEDEFMDGLPEAFAGQEIEDLHYGAGPIDSGTEDEADRELWWQETEDDDEDFIANLTGSDIEGLQSQSSVHASESDVAMSDSESTTDTDDAMDEFGFPLSFGVDDPPPADDQPLILMENWDGQFVLVQPKNDRARSRRERSSRGAGSTTDAASVSAGEQQLELVIDADAEDETDTDSDWRDFEGDDDGGDTTDSMAEEDMPMLDGSGFDELIASQQFAANAATVDYGAIPPIPLPPLAPVDENGAPMIVVTDTAFDTTVLPTTSMVTTPAATMPFVDSPAPTSPTAAVSPMPATLCSVPAPMMGTFHVSQEPCAHAVIDGSKTTTKSPFARRRRKINSETGSQGSNKRRSSLTTASTDAFSPRPKKTRYSSIPGHPRYIAARRAAQALIDPLDRETTPSDDEPAFSLEDIMDASMLRVNDIDSGDSTDKQEDARHMFRFDKVPVSMYMRRNFNSSGAKRRHVEPDSMPMYAPARGGGRTTLAETLAGPANRMLISPMLAPQPAATVYEEATSRKERRRAKRAAAMDIRPLEI